MTHSRYRRNWMAYWLQKKGVIELAPEGETPEESGEESADTPQTPEQQMPQPDWIQLSYENAKAYQLGPGKNIRADTDMEDRNGRKIFTAGYMYHVVSLYPFGDPGLIITTDIPGMNWLVTFGEDGWGTNFSYNPKGTTRRRQTPAIPTAPPETSNENIQRARAFTAEQWEQLYRDNPNLGEQLWSAVYGDPHMKIMSLLYDITRTRGAKIGVTPRQLSDAFYTGYNAGPFQARIDEVFTNSLKNLIRDGDVYYFANGVLMLQPSGARAVEVERGLAGKAKTRK